MTIAAFACSSHGLHANPGQDFGDFVTTNIARDRVASRLGAAGRASHGGPLNKRMMNTLALLLPGDDDHRLAFRPLMTDAQLARELLEYAARSLDPLQLLALRRWIDGASFDRLVRPALARLRRQFGDQTHG